MFEKLSVINLTQPDQVGIVVKNVNAVVEQYQTLLGIGGFEIVDWPVPGIDPLSTYHGQPAKWKMRTAFATLGSLQIELVEPLEGRSIFQDFIETRGPGFHHFRFTVQDIDDKLAALEKANIPLISSGRGMRSNSRWYYFDTTSLLDGVYIELRSV